MIREETTQTAADERAVRRSIYHVIVCVALALAAGRMAVVTSSEGDTAFLSANDRSRWCTVASLVEHGTYAIDKQIAIVNPIHRHRRPWQTIDKVRHVGSDGKQHYYSSKPPLLPTMVAGVYKLVHLVTGMTLTEHPIYVARIVLALVNLPMLAIFFYATIGCIERIGRSHWGRLFASIAACFGTMMLPFAVSLNNHLPAATATAAAMWLYVFAAQKIAASTDDISSRVSMWVWVAAGISAAFAAANELPALSMMGLWFLLFALLKRSSILPFGLGVIVVAVAFFGTNWIAHESFRPPYAHRGNGAPIADLNSTASEPDDELKSEIESALERRQLAPEGEVVIVPSDEPQRWVAKVDETYFALLKNETGWKLAHWDDWYEYPDTYWRDGMRRGVDRGEPSKAIYLLHMTIGHHGLFSLTPIWLLVPLGMIGGLWTGPSYFRKLAFAVLLATTVCLLFYLNRPLIDRNYGGVSVCFRWMLWFAPLWLLVITPVIDKLGHAKGRRMMLIAMLAISVFSVSASIDSPWQSPWLYRFWQFLGWINV